MLHKSIILMTLTLLLMITTDCNAKQAYVQSGDVVIWMSKAATQDSPDYLSQMRLAFLQACGKAKGVYDPIDPDLRTWDNTSYPVGVTCFCDHVELIADSGMRDYASSDYVVILRPTPLLLSLMDMEAAISKKREVEAFGINYNQPGFYVISKWRLSEEMPWFDETAKAHWAEIYGVDYNHGVNLKAAQWSPCVGQPCHYDFTCDLFWHRDVDCSSLTWYYLWWGYYCKGDPNFGNWLIDHPNWIHASDCLAPGQVADYLITRGFATVIVNGKITPITPKEIQ